MKLYYLLLTKQLNTFAKGILLLFLPIIFFTTCQTPQTNKITIAAAANMQFALKKLSQSFTSKTGIDCDLIISSSGKLTAQIKEGAPYDLLVSADMKFPNEIYKSGLAPAPPGIYGYGKLVLWSMVEGVEPSLELLEDENIKHIALANPVTAPYGAAAQTVLDTYGFSEGVHEKLVFGESIAQTNQFITSKAAEIGFTALAVVSAEGMQGKGKWVIIDPKIYAPIEQGAVLIQRKKGNADQAKQFYDFLFSKEAKEILKDFGYLVNE